MEASDWEELSFLLESAGITVEKALGLNEKKIEEVPDPTPEEFEANLKVEYKGEEFKFLMPDLAEFQVWGEQDVQEELYTPPPFMDIEKLCEPQMITPELLQEVESLKELLESMAPTDTSEEESLKAEELQDEEEGTFDLEVGSHSDRSDTPELLVVSDEGQGTTSSSSSSSKGDVSMAMGTYKVKPIHSTGSSSRMEPSSGALKGKQIMKQSIPKGKHSTTKIPHEAAKDKHISKSPTRPSQVRHASRPSFRITSKEKPTVKPLASVSVKKLPTKPASPSSSRARHSSGSPAKSQRGTTNIVNLMSRVEPRKPIKRPRAVAASKEEDSDDMTIKISDSSDESV